MEQQTTIPGNQCFNCLAPLGVFGPGSFGFGQQFLRIETSRGELLGVNFVEALAYVFELNEGAIEQLKLVGVRDMVLCDYCHQHLANVYISRYLFQDITDINSCVFDVLNSTQASRVPMQRRRVPVEPGPTQTSIQQEADYTAISFSSIELAQTQAFDPGPDPPASAPGIPFNAGTSPCLHRHCQENLDDGSGRSSFSMVQSHCRHCESLSMDSMETSSLCDGADAVSAQRDQPVPAVTHTGRNDCNTLHPQHYFSAGMEMEMGKPASLGDERLYADQNVYNLDTVDQSKIKDAANTAPTLPIPIPNGSYGRPSVVDQCKDKESSEATHEMTKATATLPLNSFSNVLVPANQTYDNGNQTPTHEQKKWPFEKDGDKCQECGSILCDAIALRKHVDLIHRRQTNFMCDICGRPNGNNSTLRKHRRTHMNAKEKRNAERSQTQHESGASFSQEGVSVKHAAKTKTPEVHTSEVREAFAKSVKSSKTQTQTHMDLRKAQEKSRVAKKRRRIPAVPLITLV